MTEIRRMDREARGGSMHGIRTWCQLSSKLYVYTSTRCHRTWKQYIQPDMLKHEVSMYLQQEHAD
ncbi:hypothetical protein F2Q69_00025142 [Brassica cretica]|uniref:Uncharacterized protein n=1 Tax=Brassica cretica TaxID=69181 RepID=A0A8S9QGW9_BRACR|nr:hypothetical protein F2Q69_00025142 [Brassica cretica]